MRRDDDDNTRILISDGGPGTVNEIEREVVMFSTKVTVDVSDS